MDKRINEKSAGYMELAGARKDADCEVVEVAGGVSRDLGCCNLFSPESSDTSIFSCGTCEYLSKNDQPDEAKPLTQKEANGMSLRSILDSQRPAEAE